MRSKLKLTALIESARDEACSGHYDIAMKTFRLHWREVYTDPEEAEFFDNQAEEGELIGVICEGISDFETSIDDHVFIGSLETLQLERATRGYRVDVRYLTEGAGVQRIAFICEAAHAEKLAGGRVVRIPLNRLLKKSVMD